MLLQFFLQLSVNLTQKPLQIAIFFAYSIILKLQFLDFSFHIF